jgi:hypothetical protein
MTILEPRTSMSVNPQRYRIPPSITPNLHFKHRQHRQTRQFRTILSRKHRRLLHFESLSNPKNDQTERQSDQLEEAGA